MTSTYRYLDICSTYRNRILYPHPADFVMNSSPTANVAMDPLHARDAISYAFPTATGTATAIIPSGTITLAANASDIDNYYINQYISQGSETRQITAYDGTTKVATVESAFSVGPTTYYIRKEQILLSSTLGPFPQSGTSTAVTADPPTVTLDGAASTVDGFYTGKLILHGDQTRTITAYDGSTLIATLNMATSSAGAYTIVTSTTPNIVIDLGQSTSTVDDAYRGAFIKFTGGPNDGITRQIVSYNGASRLATLALGVPNAPTASGNTYEILRFSKENPFPLVYPSNKFSQPVCYAMELLYIIIPNQLISSGHGGRFTDYPFFYLKLYNEGNPHASRTLYSNNPAAQNALFKVPIGVNLSTQKFFTLKDARQIQVIKFNPDQPMRFTLTLPDGSPVRFITSDTSSPASPNPLMQITATFAIRRLDNE